MQIKKPIPIIQLLTIASFLFLAFYFLFIYFSDYIHSFFIPLYYTSFLPVHAQLANEVDGIELETMTVGILLYIFVISLVFLKPKLLSSTNNVFVKCILIVSTLIIFLRTNPFVSKDFMGFDSNLHVNLLSVFLVCFLLFFLYRFSKYKFSFSKKYFLLFSMLFIPFTFFLILSSKTASVYDYNFTIGPALKILQGEKLGSFYIQYNILLSYLFALMMKIGFKIHQMQAIISISFAIWFLFYLYLGKKVIKDNFLFYLFLATFILLRFFSVGFGSFDPQVSVLRLDLWVILAIIAYKFGFESLITSFGFSLVYVLDNYFGFLYVISYLVILAFILLNRFLRSEGHGSFFLAQDSLHLRHDCRSFFARYKLRNNKVWLSKFVRLLIPIFLAFLFQLYFFHSFISQSGKIYGNLRLGFLPISERSMLWPFVFIIPLFLYFILKMKHFEKRIYLFFLLIIAISQLTYFFGRSHENNLLNLSGILLIIFFITADNFIKTYNIRKWIYCLSSVLFLIYFVTFYGPIYEKFKTVSLHIKNHYFLSEHRIEENIERLKYSKFRDEDKLVLISSFDSYLNYRLGYKQIGYLSPFTVHIFTTETVGFIVELMKQGYKPIFIKSELFFDQQLIDNQLIKDSQIKFIVRDNGDFTEILGVKTE